MKRLISVLAVLCLCTTLIFAEDGEGDFYDDGYVYEQNGAGDRFLKINLMANFPLNFGDQLYKLGGAIDAGYYQFITPTLALGGEVLVGYNVTIGNKSLILAPFTFGAMYQPVIGKFEFPMTLGIGFATISCQNETYFPGFAAKGAAGAFFRINEMWSIGAYGSAYWLPQWFKDPQYNDNGFFATVGLGARYHF